jgi:hypothetical protein
MKTLRQLALIALCLQACRTGEGDGKLARKPVALPSPNSESPRGHEKPVSDAFILSSGKLELPASGGAALQLLCRVIPVVKCPVGHGRVGLLILDTGAFATMLTPDQAMLWELSIRHLPRVDAPSSSGSMTFDSCARLDHLSMGDASVKDVDAVLVDQLPLDIPGVAGVSILSQCPLLFDGRRGEARFLAVDSVEKTLGTLYPGDRWSKLPIHWNGMSPCVELVVGEHCLRMLVDTGSSSTDLGPGIVKELGLQVVRKEHVLSSDALGEHLQDLDVVAIEGLELGHWTCNLETTASESPALISTQTHGVLGFDFLGQIPCVFDAPGGMLWVLDPSKGAQEDLRSSQDSRAIAFFEDPLPIARKFAAVSSARTGRRHLLSRVAGLLDDKVPDVRDAAAAAISAFAQESWSETSRLELARVWWEAHKLDPDNHLPP